MRDINNTTHKVNQILERSVYDTKKLLSQALGITRPTLDTRLKGESKWKRLEEFWINQTFKKLNI